MLTPSRTLKSLLTAVGISAICIIPISAVSSISAVSGTTMVAVGPHAGAVRLAASPDDIGTWIYSGINFPGDDDGLTACGERGEEFVKDYPGTYGGSQCIKGPFDGYGAVGRYNLWLFLIKPCTEHCTPIGARTAGRMTAAPLRATMRSAA
jgi:hypothetical protein